jgi:hypothetical protein
METTRGAHAPNVEMCSHLIQSGHTNQPFALYHSKKIGRYACPACIADLIERRLEMPKQEPSDVAQSVSFRRCEHSPGERACWTCMEAVSAELTGRWARLMFTDKPAANRLRRVLAHWSRYYDPQHITAREKAVIPAARIETADGRKVRLARERIERRNEAIRQQRRLPKTGTLQEQGRQTERIAVVSPVA